jgi:hypothetical protein
MRGGGAGQGSMPFGSFERELFVLCVVTSQLLGSGLVRKTNRLSNSVQLVTGDIGSNKPGYIAPKWDRTPHWETSLLEVLLGQDSQSNTAVVSSSFILSFP